MTKKNANSEKSNTKKNEYSFNIEYNFFNKTLKKTISDKYSCFLLSDFNGSYFSQGIKSNSTFYQGLVCRYFETEEWTMFKFIERIDVLRVNDNKSNQETNKHNTSINAKTTEINDINLSNNLVNFENHKFEFCDYNTLKISKHINDNNNNINHSTDETEKTKLKIYLDPRKIYDFSKFNRNIEVYEENNILISEYNNNGYKLFLGIKGHSNYEFKNNWIERNYFFDGERSGNSSWFVNEGLEIEFDESTLIAQAKTKEELFETLLNSSNSIERNINFYKENSKFEENKLLNFVDKFYQRENFFDEQKNKKDDNSELIAYLCALKSFNELILDSPGIYAGYYWFFQFWTRDETISLGGLIKEHDEKNNHIIKNILTRLFSQVLDDGRIPNRFPHANLGSADGVGWSVKRISQIINIFNENESRELIQKIKESTDKLIENHTCEDFAINLGKETWMDTTGSTNDDREGARIEIQALRLNTYKFLKENLPEQSEHYSKLETNLRTKVRELFFDGEKLADGIVKLNNEWNTDYTQRPNIFLAYYIYDELFSQQEWEKIFDYALPRLWLDWGGLSTIDVNHELFKKEYTGENDDSYHRGDSWYFVNNISAISLNKLNKNKYQKYISKIKNASIKDILEKGMLGSASEVSSACEQKAEGTWHQAWSISTFIELIHELHE